MPSPLALLAETIEPRRRARLLTDLAEQHDAAGHPYSATLARIVAESEQLLADPGYEPEDPSWEHEIWHPLATTANRVLRATLLERVHAEWARPRVGADADILLAIAETERDAADEATASPEPALEPDTEDGESRVSISLAVQIAARLARPVLATAAVICIALPGPGADTKLTAAAGLALSLTVWVAARFLRDRRGWRP